MDYTITITDTQKKALEYVALDVDIVHLGALPALTFSSV